MDLINREQCADCPNRGKVSCAVAKVVLGSDFTAEGCDSRVRVRQDNEHFTSSDGSIGGTISTVKYDCGKPNEDGTSKPDFISYNWDNGELVSTTNHDTEVYVNFRNPEYSDPQV